MCAEHDQKIWAVDHVCLIMSEVNAIVQEPVKSLIGVNSFIADIDMKQFGILIE